MEEPCLQELPEVTNHLHAKKTLPTSHSRSAAWPPARVTKRTPMRQRGGQRPSPTDSASPSSHCAVKARAELSEVTGTTTRGRSPGLFWQRSSHWCPRARSSPAPCSTQRHVSAVNWSGGGHDLDPNNNNNISNPPCEPRLVCSPFRAAMPPHVSVNLRSATQGRWSKGDFGECLCASSV
jgi:hypothetical protein